jgi:hypothetical protein
MSTTAFVGGCKGEKAPPPARIELAKPDSGPPQFVQQSFEDLYPIFLLRKVKPGPKAALWRDYYGHWVRWAGTVVSFTSNGITLKQLPQTVTFDVSLWIEAPLRPDLHQRIKVGDRVSYIGRLDSYDDVFRTLYLVHGSVLANLGKPDGGG